MFSLHGGDGCPAALGLGRIVMSLAALAGLGSGALHAVSGPDHLLSLAPLSLGLNRRAWRVGWWWGVGHALGTLACATVMLAITSLLDLDVMARWGDRIAGAALVVMGAVGLRRWASLRSTGLKAVQAGPTQKVSTWSVLSIGLIHGLSGAAAVLLLLPAALSASLVWKVVFLGGFALGSTVAMAALTAALAAGSRRMPRPEALLRHVPAVASLGSVVLGGSWVFA